MGDFVQIYTHRKRGKFTTGFMLTPFMYIFCQFKLIALRANKDQMQIGNAEEYYMEVVISPSTPIVIANSYSWIKLKT